MRASTVTRLYVCSVCWQPLVELYNEGTPTVLCSVYRQLHAGFHRYETAESGRKHSGQDLMDFMNLYRDSQFAEMLGIAPRLSPQDALERGRKLLGRDPGGID